MITQLEYLAAHHEEFIPIHLARVVQIAVPQKLAPVLLRSQAHAIVRHAINPFKVSFFHRKLHPALHFPDRILINDERVGNIGDLRIDSIVNSQIFAHFGQQAEEGFKIHTTFPLSFRQCGEKRENVGGGKLASLQQVRLFTEGDEFVYVHASGVLPAVHIKYILKLPTAIGGAIVHFLRESDHTGGAEREWDTLHISSPLEQAFKLLEIDAIGDSFLICMHSDDSVAAQRPRSKIVLDLLVREPFVIELALPHDVHNLVRADHTIFIKIIR
mmetsp:Transcript_36110/g.58284  ORF Transcript_36110/g.58284 Transcript_36110/m.58284 type:complete len:272 (-) Transcript_36110:558-1373(-)